MSVRGRRSIIIGIVGCVALGVLVVATRGHAAPPAPAPLYSYPPNARQLIAAGLTGRPVGQNLSGPATIDLVLGTEVMEYPEDRAADLMDEFFAKSHKRAA